MNQNDAKADGFESRTAQRISQSSSQIIDTFGRQIKVFDSNVAKRIETSSSEFVEMMRNLHTKVNVLESRMKDRYDNSAVLAGRLAEKVNVVIRNLPYRSSRNNLDNYVQDLGISTLCNPWTTIQHRFNGSIDFFRSWNSYKNGFGDQQGEFWIGLQPLHRMTRSEKHELLIVLEDFDGTIAHALYDDFKIGHDNEKYELKKLGEYSGTAGNSFDAHVGMPFSTGDKDNGKRCAREHRGGWWFRSGGDCINCNLNGKYYQQSTVQKMQGLNWYHWHGDYYSLKSTKMMIRRRSVTAG
ncbi:AGAP012000-PA-like protein [Anopheles sinensis]|uniref:AGAP012000-PA-like protein n=1 Tax=Anopheles sinensis TaxID=74873 RepID=A0A084W6I7_ANOSI|nr:AGAP012000-PA-like protein [Anopheles sinensis]